MLPVSIAQNDHEALQVADHEALQVAGSPDGK